MAVMDLTVLSIVLTVFAPFAWTNPVKETGTLLNSKQLDNLKKQLVEIDEGYKDEIYKDPIGHLTFGIGHMVKPSDPEHGKPVGTKVTKKRIDEAFKADVSIAMEDVKAIFPDADRYPGEVKEILVNMAFNLGRTRLLKFTKFIAAVKERDWDTAADEMVDSKWYGQVGNRAVRLVERMRNMANKKWKTIPKWIANLKKQLKTDEGCKEEIYEDSEGHLTFGIGHKVKPTDPENGKPVGTKVTKKRIKEAFKADVSIALEDAKAIFPDFDKYPGAVKDIIGNMAFNLGRTRLVKFTNFIAAVKEREWDTAANEMVESKWYGQVGDRAKKLVEQMRAVANRKWKVIPKWLANLKKQLKIDEGYKEEIYEDSEGHLTFGIGHKVKPTDPENGKPVGTRIRRKRIKEAFKADVAKAVEDVKAIFPDFDKYPGRVKEILANMVFNLGQTGLAKFTKFIAAVKQRDWGTAADEMVESKWYGQVGDRAERLVEQMRAIANKKWKKIPKWFANLKKQLKIDEGYKEEIYEDSEGHFTFGIGHKVKPTDSENGKPVGTRVSRKRIKEAFKADVAIALEDAKAIFPDFEKYPGVVKEIIGNMAFNLGRTSLAKFIKFKAAVNERDWQTAADEMVKSKWYGQVGDRAKRLVERMRKVKNKTKKKN